MTIAHYLTAYLNINLLVITGYLCLRIYSLAAGFFKKTIGAQSLLKMHYGILSILFFIVLLYPMLPENKSVYSPVKILPAQSENILSPAYSPSFDADYLVLSGNRRAGSINTDTVKYALGGFILIILATGFLKISSDIRRLIIIRKKSYLIKKYRFVSIYANDEIKIPFSYWFPGKAGIIIPTELVSKKIDYKITVYHELQHHRNGDTKWIYFIWLLRSVCIINPFIHLWSRLISELQEFACDEVLVDQKKIDSQEYARCLFEAARSASNCTRVPVCATGLTFMVQRQLLKRRIERMLKNIHNPLKKQVSFSVVLIIMLLMTCISCSSKGMVKDRRITMEQASQLAQNAAGDSEIPVVVNDLVLKELNTYMETYEGREFIKAALDRMEIYRKDIKEKITQYGVPDELLALPLIESGYSKVQKSRSGAAGIWQFIESTASKFGLKTDDREDERLDANASTDAAMRYLLSNKNRFNDWQLAVLAYNIGESNVEKTIEKTGSRNVWDVSRAFFRNGNNYYAKFMAAVIIMKNPDYVSQQLNGTKATNSIWANNSIEPGLPMKGWISSKYGYRTSPFSGKKEFHKGLDIAAKKGTPIFTVNAGIVKKVDFLPEQSGNIVVVQHSNCQTLYAQCEKVLVKEGQSVKIGEKIATCGSSGKSTGPHLHFEVIVDGKRIDPQKFLVERQYQ